MPSAMTLSLFMFFCMNLNQHTQKTPARTPFTMAPLGSTPDISAVMGRLNYILRHDFSQQLEEDQARGILRDLFKPNVDYGLLAIALTWLPDDIEVLDMAKAYAIIDELPKPVAPGLDGKYFRWALENAFPIRESNRPVNDMSLGIKKQVAEAVAKRAGLTRGDLKQKIYGSLLRRSLAMFEERIAGAGPNAEWVQKSLTARFNGTKRAGLPLLNQP